jgi:hypothetical protein
MLDIDLGRSVNFEVLLVTIFLILMSYFFVSNKYTV